MRLHVIKQGKTHTATHVTECQTSGAGFSESTTFINPQIWVKVFLLLFFLFWPWKKDAAILKKYYFLLRKIIVSYCLWPFQHKMVSFERDSANEMTFDRCINQIFFLDQFENRSSLAPPNRNHLSSSYFVILVPLVTRYRWLLPWKH